MLEWTDEDHTAEINKRVRPKESNSEPSKKGWVKFLECKMGIGLEVASILKDEPEIEATEDLAVQEEREAERLANAFQAFEEKWADAPLSNVYNLWCHIKAAAREAAGEEKSTKGRKKRVGDTEDGSEREVKRRRGRPIESERRNGEVVQ